MKKIVKIDPLESHLFLTEIALENLIRDGIQVSTIDFDGYVWPAPVFKDRHKWILSLDTNDHCLYITATSKRCKNITEKDKWKLIDKLFKEGCLEDNSLEPFEDMHPQLGVELNPDKTEIAEQKFFPYDNPVDQKEDLTMNLNNPTVTSKRIIRKALIACPYCGRIGSFEVENALDSLAEFGGDGIDTICPWCGERIALDMEHLSKAKIIYKEDNDSIEVEDEDEE